MILYLHGFRSSPQSAKASLFAHAMVNAGRGAQWLCPQLPASPQAAVTLALDLLASAGLQLSGQLSGRDSGRDSGQLSGQDSGQHSGQFGANELTIVGSSLGGFYATWLAEKIGCRAVLLNPAVNPVRELEKQVGITTTWQGDAPFEFKATYVDELRALQVSTITRPQRYFLLAATGDAVLDWREMVAFYPGARQRIIQGSDHGISNFADYLDEVLAFCDHPVGSPDAQ